MSKSPQTQLLVHVRHRRVSQNLSQAELAQRVGMSRQALSAVEGGKQVPSTQLALGLALALDCSVHDLFTLDTGDVIEVAIATWGIGSPLAIGDRVAIGRVRDRWIAHALTASAGVPADGVVLSAHGGIAQVRTFEGADTIANNVLVAGCAPLLGNLSARCAHSSDAKATWIHAGSEQSLRMLELGLVHIAGVHLSDQSDEHTNLVRTRFSNERMLVANLTRWRQGLIVAAGNPLDLREVSDLVRPHLRYAHREAGAGASRLLQRLLHQAPSNAHDAAHKPATVATGSASKNSPTEPSPKLRRTEAAKPTPGVRTDEQSPGESELPLGPLAHTHDEVALLVRSGAADAGIAIESVAIANRLHFVPLADERFDLVVPAAFAELPHVARLLNTLDTRQFRADAGSIAGYDSSLAGQVTTLEAP